MNFSELNIKITNYININTSDYSKRIRTVLEYIDEEKMILSYSSILEKDFFNSDNVILEIPKDSTNYTGNSKILAITKMNNSTKITVEVPSDVYSKLDREFYRLGSAFKVCISCLDQFKNPMQIAGMSLDISAGGIRVGRLFIRSNDNQKLLEKINNFSDFVIEIEFNNDTKFKLNAELVRVEQKKVFACAFKFINVSEKEISELCKAIYKFQFKK